MFFDPSPIFTVTVALYVGTIWGLVVGVKYIQNKDFRARYRKHAMRLTLWFIASVFSAFLIVATWIAVYANIGNS